MPDYTSVTAHRSEKGSPWLRFHYYDLDWHDYRYSVVYPHDPGYNPDLAKALLALQDATIHYYEENKK